MRGGGCAHRRHDGRQVLVVGDEEIALLDGAGGHVAQVADLAVDRQPLVGHADVQGARRHTNVCAAIPARCLNDALSDAHDHNEVEAAYILVIVRASADPLCPTEKQK